MSGAGYTANIIANHMEVDDGVEFIQKPFSMNDLAAKVRSVQCLTNQLNENGKPLNIIRGYDHVNRVVAGLCPLPSAKYAGDTKIKRSDSTGPF